eukprot:457631-Prorocentrum_minimum.AAC.1
MWRRLHDLHRVAMPLEGLVFLQRAPCRRGALASHPQQWGVTPGIQHRNRLWHFPYIAACVGCVTGH